MAKHGRDDIHMTPDVSHIQNPDVSHEASDVNIKGILIFVVGLLVLGVVTALLMSGLYRVLEAREAKRDAPTSPLALSEKERLPPAGAPRLQLAPDWVVEGENLELKQPQDEKIIVMRKWENEMKNGIVDPKTGARVSIPIKDAMQNFLGNVDKLAPARPQANQTTQSQTGIDVPAYSSSGRMTEKRIQ